MPGIFVDVSLEDLEMTENFKNLALQVLSVMVIFFLLMVCNPGSAQELLVMTNFKHRTFLETRNL